MKTIYVYKGVLMSTCHISDAFPMKDIGNTIGNAKYKFPISESGISLKSSSAIVWSSSKFLGSHLRTLSFKIDYMFSMIFKSGEHGG